jgi:hypothetical protein
MGWSSNCTLDTESRSPLQSETRVTQKPGYHFNKKTCTPLAADSQRQNASGVTQKHEYEFNTKHYREVSRLGGSLKPLSSTADRGEYIIAAIVLPQFFVLFRIFRRIEISRIVIAIYRILQ